jgi:hypothetical protein
MHSTPVLNAKLKVGKKAVGADGNLWVAFPDNSEQTITVTAKGVHHYDAGVTVTKVVPDVQLAVDLNRDRSISFGADDQTSPANPYRFWVNDVGYSGDIISSGDVPGSGHNGSTGQVNGRVDVINFFPVKLRIGMTSPAPPDGLEYRLAGSSSLYFAYADPTEVNDFDYLTDAGGVTAYGSSLTSPPFSADTVQIKPDGVALGQNFTNKMAQHSGTGMVLMEAAAPVTTPLELQVFWHNQWIYSTNLYLSISGVEQMYRQINLRNGLPGQPSEPPNYPDSLCNGNQMVFIHGFSVGENDARGWNAEVFKRLFQSGSHAMFTGVDWQGDETAWFDSSGKLDYYDNVKNAFLTASNFKAAVSGLPGIQKYVIAHSLGNMVVSSAIADFDLSVNSYFALDAAVPTEAYDGNNSFMDMVNVNAFSTFDGWTSYDGRLRASDWHNMFSSGDGRAALTWVNRFGVISSFYNFYSSGEDVLRNSDGTYPDPISTVWFQHELAWVYQEMSKGNALTSLTSSGSQAGWELNTYWYILPDGAPPGGNTFPRRRYQANVADYTDNTDTSGHININDVPVHPFFEPFNDSQVMDASAGSAEASKFDVRADILAGGIPALSHATGANFVSVFGVSRNKDMMTMETEWPQARLNIERLNNRWLHSDFKDVAYPFVHSLYDNLVNVEGF